MAANYPFATIEPNTGAVPVPDPRLQKLAELAKSEKVIPTQVTFVDIAGLIRGASKGEGLGNQFLGHIRSVDAVAHVVRCFADENVVHVDGDVDPVRDVETIETELLLSDLESVQKQVQKQEKMAKSRDKEAVEKLRVFKVLEEHLGDGKPARNCEVESEFRDEIFSQLLTAKPILYVANVSEDDAATSADPSGDRPVDKLAKFCQEQGDNMVIISGKVEAEIAELAREERAEYLEAIGLEMSGLDRLILAGYTLLGLFTFFTAGPKEARAWTATNGSSAPQCAGKIHTDFERGFIRAEVISYDDYVNCGSEVKAKEAGKLRTEGKEYIMQDGDVVHFRFNV